MFAVIQTLVEVLDIYLWIVIAWVVLSWLVQFGMVNRYNQFVATASDLLDRLTEPALRPIRSVVPLVGGIDLSPLVLIVAIHFLQRFLIIDLMRMMGGLY